MNGVVMATQRIRHQVPESVLNALPENRLGERVRELRLNLGLSQADVAEGLGVPPSWVGHIETGHTGLPSRERLFALAQVLQTDTLDLMIAAGYWTESNVYAGIDPQLLAVARGATAESQKTVIDLLRQINRVG
jgi:transcriptional regulator with XRE-family HTH domain